MYGGRATLGVTYLWWEDTLCDKHLSNLQTVKGIDGQYSNSNLADCGTAEQSWAIPDKMLLPCVFTRVKESHDVLGFLMYPGDIRPFAGIAVQTAIGKILQNAQSTVFFSNDMIDLKG